MKLLKLRFRSFKFAWSRSGIEPDRELFERSRANKADVKELGISPEKLLSWR